MGGQRSPHPWKPIGRLSSITLWDLMVLNLGDTYHKSCKGSFLEIDEAMNGWRFHCAPCDVYLTGNGLSVAGCDIRVSKLDF